MTGGVALHAALAIGELAAKSLLVLALAWLITLLLRKGPSATRHLTWLSAFCMLLAMPFLTLVVPGRQLAQLHYSATSLPSHFEAEPVKLQPAEGIILPAPQLTDFSNSGSTTNAVRTQSTLQRSLDWKLIASVGLALWIAGVLALFTQGLWGLCGLWRLNKRASRPVRMDPQAIDLRKLSRQIGVNRTWELRISEISQPPAAMTWGIFRPIVLLPKASESWSNERLEAVLLHELAHVRRFDCVSQLIAVAASALYWLNPAIWLCARAMRAEAEAAADDTVIKLGIKPSDYARELLKIAADLGQRRQPFTNIGVPVMKQSKIESRVKAILDPSARRRRGVSLLEALATVSISAIIAIPLSSLHSSMAAVPAEPGLYPPVQTSEARLQTEKLDKEKEARRLEAQAKLLRDKAKASRDISLSTDRRKMAAELKALMAEQAEMRAELAKAKAELAQAKARLQGEAKVLEALRKAKEHASEDQKYTAKSLEDLLKSQNKMSEEDAGHLYKELFRAQEEARKSQSSIQLKQRAEMDQQLSEMKRQMGMAKEQYQKAREDALRSKLGGERSPSPQQNKAMVELATTKLQMAQKSLDRIKKLYQTGVITAEEVDKAELAVAEAKTQLKMAQARLESASQR